MAAKPKCRICKRPLKNITSIANGIGRECAEKYASLMVGAGLTVEQLGFTSAQLGDGEVKRWLHYAEQAVIAECSTDTERFKQRAIEAARRVQLPTAA